MDDMESAFLSSITEAPDDDAPRLVFADWLDDNGHAARARLIRVQCEQARGGAPPTAPDKEAAAAWASVLPSLAGEPRVLRAWLYRRGIPEGVRFGPTDLYLYKEGTSDPLDELIRNADRVFSVPTVREVVIEARLVVDYDYGKAYRPHEARGAFLSVGLATLAKLPGLARLRRLVLKNAILSTRGLEALLASPGLAGVRSLDLSGSDVSTAVVEVLARSPLAPRLEELELCGVIHGYPTRRVVCAEGAAVEAIAFATLSNLTVLDLSWNGLNDAAAESLLVTSSLPRLTRLRIAGHSLCEHQLRRLRERFADVRTEVDTTQSWDPWYERQS